MFKPYYYLLLATVWLLVACEQDPIYTVPEIENQFIDFRYNDAPVSLRSLRQDGQSFTEARLLPEEGEMHLSLERFSVNQETRVSIRVRGITVTFTDAGLVNIGELGELDGDFTMISREIEGNVFGTFSRAGDEVVQLAIKLQIDEWDQNEIMTGVFRVEAADADPDHAITDGSFRLYVPRI